MKRWAEYIWLDVNKELRSKTKVIRYGEVLEREENRDGLTPQTLAFFFPEWNFDGSSTGQAEGLNSELILSETTLSLTFFLSVLLGCLLGLLPELDIKLNFLMS